MPEQKLLSAPKEKLSIIPPIDSAEKLKNSHQNLEQLKLFLLLVVFLIFLIFQQKNFVDKIKAFSLLSDSKDVGGDVQDNSALLIKKESLKEQLSDLDNNFLKRSGKVEAVILKGFENSKEINDEKTSNSFPDSSKESFLKKELSSFIVEASSAIAIDDKIKYFFYQKDIFKRLPIASLTKLMTALIVFEKGNLDDVFVISKEAVRNEGNAGRLVVGEKLSILKLVQIMLIESSNDAAFSLEEYYLSKGLNLVSLMNEKAKELDLKETNFTNSAGLDNQNHYSTAYDIAKIAGYSLKYEKLWEILRTKNLEISSEDGKIKHRLLNSDKLLGTIKEIVGGKTGYTQNAKGCILLVLDISPSKRIIVVILGARDSTARFEEAKKLINWLKISYIWE